MPDITMCRGDGCILKNSCYRNSAKPGTYQSYFASSPHNGEKGDDFECAYFWYNSPGDSDEAKALIKKHLAPPSDKS